MTVALGRIQITVAITADRTSRPAPPTNAERVHRLNAFTRSMESARVRWRTEVGRWM
jgi:hypothetical protein